MARPSWRGFLRLSLVNVPVQAFTALVTGQGEVHLHQLHRPCHSRIRYQKTCPIHGEVRPEEIVMGYEVEKDRYVEVDDDERRQARTRSDKSIGVDAFVPLDSIDPLHFTGRSYYLLPDGVGAEKPYALLLATMQAEKRQAVGEVALSGRDEIVAVRALGKLFVMHMLYFAAQLKPSDEFADEVPSSKPRADELKLAKLLVQRSTPRKFDLAQYQDTYTDKLRELIEAKVEGHKVVNPPEEEERPSIHLMDALRRSVAQQERGTRKPTKAKASSRAAIPAARRRKSS